MSANSNLLNYPETVTPYHYNWAPLVGGGRMSCVSPQKGPSVTICQETRVGKTLDAGWDCDEYKEENKLVAGDIRDTLAWENAVVTMFDHLFGETAHERLHL